MPFLPFSFGIAPLLTICLDCCSIMFTTGYTSVSLIIKSRHTSCRQMEPHLSVWFRAVMVFSVEVLWLVGICCLIGYYAFLHPDRENLGSSRNQASWRS